MPKGIALITGAGSGIGAELAELCAKAGYGVILVARDRTALEALSTRLAGRWHVPAHVLPADLSDPAAPQRVFEQTAAIGPVEILINNAGFGLRGAFADTDWSTEARMIQVNLTSLAELTKLFLPPMLERHAGRILNVASTAAFVPGPFMAIYYATKAFVVSFSHALANETRGSGVTVTVLCPGPTSTDFFRAAGIEGSSLAKRRGRMMTAAEVAREGWNAMMAGRAEVIAGARNRWMIFGARLAPRTLLAKITRGMNSDVAPT